MSNARFLTKARVMLKFEEGVRLYPYDDATGKRVRAPSGKITIGVGHNLDARPLSTDVLELILEEDIEAALCGCERLFSAFHALSENRKLALLDMCFNMGEGALAEFARLRDAIEKADFERAAEEVRRSAYFKQVPARATRKEAMIAGDVYPYTSAGAAL
jgi:GH24 family phage-related lysozyme (muramidase)